MNISIQHPKPYGLVQPSGHSSQSSPRGIPVPVPPGEATLSAWRKLPGRFTFAALLAGLLFLLFSAPSARAQTKPNHESPVGCTGSGLGIFLFTDTHCVHVGDTICYSVTVFNGASNGPVVCDASAITAFVTTPDGVSHPIALSRTALSNGQSDYYPNVVCYVVRAVDINISDGTVRATANDTGTIHQNDSNSTGGGFQGVNTEVSLPCIQVAVQCVSTNGENGAINFTGTVTNCGNTTLVGVTVTSFVNGGQFPVASITSIATNQSASFSGSWVPLNPCSPSTATFVAQGGDLCAIRATNVTSSASTTCQNTLKPGIVVTKACPERPVSPGQLLTFSGSVSNTGNVTLTNIVVVNNQPAPNTPVFTLPSLAPGVVATFTGNYMAPTNCSVTDTLTATATSRCGDGVASIASANCPILTAPQITVTAGCPTAPVLPGGSLIYSGTVQNTGNITLTNVVVVSDRPATNTTVIGPITLAPGASATFTGTYPVPTNACTVTTTFSGTGRDICTLKTVTNSVSPTCTVTTAPAIAVTLVCPTGSATNGGLITYTGTVSNPGNVTLNNVFVLNNQPAPNTPLIGPITLTPGASSIFTASFTAPAGACSVSSTVIVTGNDICTQAMVTNTASAACKLNTTPGIKVTKVCPERSFPGQLLTFSGSVSNTGNVTLINIVVVNNQPAANTPVFTVASLAPGAVTNFIGSYLAPTNCSVDDTLTATGRSICGDVATNTASASCPITTTPGIVVTKACPAKPVSPGQLLIFSGSVSNTGNVTLTNIVVVNNQPFANTPVFTLPSLAPGVAAPFSGSYLAPTNCSVADTLTVRASSLCGDAVANTVTASCPITTTPGIVVTKACPAKPVSPGQLLTFSGSVSNTGNVTLTNIVVVNNQPAANTMVFTVASLAPGAVTNFIGSYLAPTNCSVTDTLTATGQSVCGDAVTNTASANCLITTTPRIVVTKACPAKPVSPGQLLIFSGSVSNTGNVTLTNIVVVNNQLFANTPVFTLPSLAPGVAVPFSGSYLAPTNCSVADTLTVRASSLCGDAVTNTASATCLITTTPAIVVTTYCPTNPVGQGGTLTYSGTVSNAGNITLTNIIVVNHWPYSNVIFTATSLAPGATTNFTGSYVVPLNCCVAWMWVEVSGQGCDGFTVTDTESGTCTVLTLPSIVVTKVCVPTMRRGLPVLLRPGDLLTYSGTVCNNGNVTLYNVTVVDNQPINNTLVIGPDILAPGECKPYTASYIVPPDFCGDDTVTARGFDYCSGAPVTNSATATCPIAPYSPRIVVTKRCPEQPTQHGGQLIYSGTVSNAGNVTLINVFVVDNQPSNNTPVIGPITLTPGASYEFKGSYTTPLVCCTTIDTLTAHGQDWCSRSNVSDTATAICPMLYTPGIALVQICPPDLTMGSVYRFSGIVTNTGDAILTNVVVFGPQGTFGPQGNNTSVLGPIDLAPGDSQQYSGSLTVPTNTCTVTITVTSQETCAGTWITNTISCPILTAPQITVTLACPPDARLVPGGSVTYSGTVRNTGNITLTNVVVVNSQIGTVLTVPSLTPGAFATFGASFTAPIDACSVSSTVIATGSDICTQAMVTNTASAICKLITTPDIKVTKECPGSVSPGQLLTFSGSVSNTGNVTLINIVVFNNQPAANTRVFTVASLAPGTGTNFTGSYLAPTNCFFVADTLTARGLSICGVVVTNTVSRECPIITTPVMTITEDCPSGPVTNGSLVTFGGQVCNTGDITLTNIFVFSSSTSTPVLGPIWLAPGACLPFTGSFIATGGCNPTNNLTLTPTNILTITPTNILIVTPTNNVTLTPTNILTLTPTNILTITTNTAGTVTTNNTVTVTTNASTAPMFGTIDSTKGTYTNRFIVPTILKGLTYAPEDHGEPPGQATEFYSIRKDTNTGTSWFESILASTAAVTDRFGVTSGNFDALTYAAEAVGPGPLLFWYLRHDTAGGSILGTITPGAPGVGVVADIGLVGTNFVALTYTATDVGYGANMFYYVRRVDTNGLSMFGSLTPAGVATDRFTIGNNVNALVFTPLIATGYGPNDFYYLRQNPTNGVSTFGHLHLTPPSPPTAGVWTDLFDVGTNATELTYTFTDVAFGQNLFYYLRPERSTLTTNIVTTFVTNTVPGFVTNTAPGFVTNTVPGFVTNTVPGFVTNTVSGFVTNTVPGFTTNSVVTFTPTNTVTANGVSICQVPVTATANCGCVTSPLRGPVIGKLTINSDHNLSLSFPTEQGKSYTVQYKNNLSDTAWTDLETVVGTGGNLNINDPTPAGLPSRFYRITSP